MGIVKIRKALISDLESILKIYEYYVTNTAITFDTKIPTIEEFNSRMEIVFKKYPYIVAELDGEIVGYAYTHPFVGREAYDWSAETTIYIKNNMKGNGIGKKLYETIENISKAQNILNLYACIGYPDVEDEYLTNNSVDFHKHMGYKWVGIFQKCGYKFDRWYNMVWMEKILGEHKPNISPVIPFPQFSPEILSELGLE
ncbi:acyl-CoA N-acyltransferase [Anaeromyces robustus]|uniref:Acyl-CoA N-acyltransferase n=1 Tax=Anaeromyces robustus TaxID=1754192 RepID=A0A1Y1WQ66_9FUNG|nr:acyl-CoA N-acyltransferase [Anaeromyces robustus]|eukprot:ORX75670.1 acyl-CoA N-acyltransferase [Anaeromyces robustus]